MANYTASDLITLAQRHLTDTDDGAYEDNLLAYLNEGVRRFATETHCCQSLLTATLTDETTALSTLAASITGAETILDVFKFRLNSGSTYTFLPRALIGESKTLPASSVTAPTRYSLFADTLVLNLHPDAAVSVSSTLWCSWLPADMTLTTDTVYIPNQWANALVHYMEYCCRAEDRDMNLASAAFAAYESIRVQAAGYYRQIMEAA